jgi:exoribonuclease II
VLGAADLPRGARVRLKLGEIDLITLDVSGTVIQRLDTAPEAVSAEDDTEEETVAGPIAIAVDVTDTSEDNSTVAPAAPM